MHIKFIYFRMLLISACQLITPARSTCQLITPREAEAHKKISIV